MEKNVEVPSTAWIISSIDHAESSQGFYLRVSCADEAEEKKVIRERLSSSSQESSERSEHSDEDGSGMGEVSEEGSSSDSNGSESYIPASCSLDEGDLRRLTITPKIKVTITADKTGGFRIFGPFRKGTYNIKIAKGALSEAGSKLSQDFAKDIEIPKRSPRINFATNGRYIPEKIWKSVPISFVNVPNVKVTVKHVPFANVGQWLNRHNERVDSKIGDLVADDVIRLSGKEDESAAAFIDLSRLVTRPSKGIYEVQLTIGKESNVADFRRFLITNLNLIAKQQQNDGSYFVSALDAETGEPVRGVTINAVTPSGRIVSSCKTSKGGCQVASSQKGALDQTEATALMAINGDDFTYLRFSDLKVDTSDSDIHGVPYRTPLAYSASIYGDRDIYRPGETVRLVAILRDASMAAPANGMPVSFSVEDSRGRSVKKATIKTNSAGVVEISVPLDHASVTGEYRAHVEVAGNRIKWRKFQVEDFVPERLRVTGSFKKEAFLSTESPQLDFVTEYLFGGKAAGADFDVQCELKPALFLPKKNADYTYAVFRSADEDSKTIPLGNVSGKLSSAGKGSAKCLDAKAHARFSGKMTVFAKAAVSEVGSGRATQKVFSADVHPENFYVGLKSTVNRIRSGETAIVKGIVVGHEGEINASERELNVSIFRMKVEHNWRYDGSLGEHRYIRNVHLEKESITKVKVVGGQFEIPVAAVGSAPGYLVRVQGGNARTDLQIEGSGSSYSWDYWESSTERTPGPMKPTALNLIAPVETKVGQKGKVTVEMPYRGWVLMTLESDRVLTSEWVEVKQAGAFEWSFKVTELQPNVYVSALLVKDPYLESKKSFLPERAFGVKSIRVVPESLMGTLNITAPKTVRPKEKLTVSLNLPNAEEETYVTLAAVDEGILQLTDFKTPDPLQDLLQKRALGVLTYETVGWNYLIPSQAETSKTGGDRNGEQKDSSPPRPVKPVALWSGLIRMSKAGTASVTFDVPSFRGELRLMAVAVGKHKIAVAEGEVKVTEPLVMQPTTPRFLALGDRADIPVFLSNTTNETKKVDVTLTVENYDSGDGAQAFSGAAQLPISILDARTQKVTVPALKSAVVNFKIVANQPFGGAKLLFKVSGSDVNASDEAEIPLLAPHPLLKQDTFSKINTAKQALSLPPQVFIAGTERTTVTLTANPFLPMIAGHLPTLVLYPHGCVEQTTSKTRPMLYLSNLVSDLDPSLGQAEKIRVNVQAGIQRILSMQTSNGGFGYWPGDTRPNHFGSVIATDLLQEAQKAGYDVPVDRIGNAVGFLEQLLVNELMNRSTESAIQKTWYGWDIEPYLHYLLARSGKFQKARLESLFAHEKDMDFETSYLLKAALYLSGNRRFESELRTPFFPRLTSSSYNTWGYYSELRGMALVLGIQSDLFPGSDSALPLAQEVAQRLDARNGRTWEYSTQELGFGITSLGKMIRSTSLKQTDAKLLLDGRAQVRVAGTDESSYSWRFRGGTDRRLQLELNAKGPVNLFAHTSSLGIAKNPSTLYAHSGLKVEHRFLNLKGEPMDLKKPLRLGEIVVAEITLTNTTKDRHYRDLALTYQFPAGLEIENPRIGRGNSLPWLDEESLWSVDYTDIRDSKISYYGGINPGQEQKMTVAMRATLAGAFVGGFIDAIAMYDARVFSRLATPGVTIKNEK